MIQKNVFLCINIRGAYEELRSSHVINCGNRRVERVERGEVKGGLGACT